MKKVYIFFTIILFNHFFSQKIDFEPNIRVYYDASLQLGEKYHHDQKFVLIGNSRDYFFAAAQNYLNDTGQYKAKALIDTQIMSDYFQERVIRKDRASYVYFTYADDKIQYNENVALKWVLYAETKIINGVKCQMAATNKYGRRWIAYFSKEYPQPLGPYKFTGLPGLIFELYDIRNDYHFTLTKIEKFNDNFKFNLGAFGKFDKKNYLKAKNNLLYTMAAFPGMEESENKYFQSLLEKRKIMENNPLELKPFE